MKRFNSADRHQGNATLKSEQGRLWPTLANPRQPIWPANVGPSIFVRCCVLLCVVCCCGCGSCLWCGCWFGPPAPDPLPPDRPTFRSFFSSPVRSFCLSLVFSWNFGGVFEGRDPQTPASSGPPGLHTTTRELQTCTFDDPAALPNTTKKPREDTQ